MVLNGTQRAELSINTSLPPVGTPRAPFRCCGMSLNAESRETPETPPHCPSIFITASAASTHVGLDEVVLIGLREGNVPAGQKGLQLAGNPERSFVVLCRTGVDNLPANGP